MATLRVSPWDYSTIRKNAKDKTEDEFATWMLEKWPDLRNHVSEQVEVEVDWGGGAEPTGEVIPSRASYILSIRPLR
jgi:hypothetical protein